MVPDLLTLAKNVKRGVRLLDRTFPTWRRVMRRHQARFNLRDPQYCILGTLEHHLGRARILRLKAGRSDSGYHGLRAALHIKTGNAYGFDAVTTSPRFGGHPPMVGEHPIEGQFVCLSALWRAEFER